jgi:hypothetical protein
MPLSRTMKRSRTAWRSLSTSSMPMKTSPDDVN